ncbi:hypothetical protein ACFPTR_09045 [Aliibacillus thermotolerans]|uniref:GapA-binding peptide SR1P n=1 Tax=Aliibacillus thermotolerans TaxID=1834418 RepID=A0ABW0U7U4_9BACI|nr:hypothetical protein [Aliibacillus thermotolerans]
MQEYVGTCEQCHRPIYCMDGFLDGVVTDEQTLYCNSCAEQDRYTDK